MSIRIGNHVVHREQPSWGIGRVVGMSNDGNRLAVRFSGRPREELQVSARDPGVVRYRYQPGDGVRLRVADERIVPGVVRSNDPDEEHDFLEVEAEGELYEVLERNVASLPPASGVVEALAAGRWGEAKGFLLRQETLRLDVERRCDALGALFSSRVMVKPYQVAVAQRVLTDRTPRYVLADEVGLGKTIEAGMILSALLHARMAKRVLVVAPSHLAVQWLAELLHKFNQRFTLLDKERVKALLEEDPVGDPWHEHSLVVTTLELLSRSKLAREAVSDEENRWDLVVIDEAHHLRGDREFDAALALAQNTWGLLLLTATPLKLDPDEYFRLLRLVETAPAQTLEEFERRLERQADLTALVKALEEATPAQVTKQAQKVAKLFPKDKQLAAYAKSAGKDPQAREALLDHVAEIYSLSARLIRNRRAVVGGFTKRHLHRIDVALDEAWTQLHRDVQDALFSARKDGTLPEGAPLAHLLRRLDSSPAALAKALEARKEPALANLAGRAAALSGLNRDPKLRALHDRLQEIERAEPGAKIIVFTESRETLDYLVAELTRSGIDSLWYHGDLGTLERDRMVARFRDENGPRVLVSTEAGGEGRNFQFCHHLVHYDLPWSPSAIEQRIGRIDRVGQTRTVDVYVLRPSGTLASRVVDLFADDVQVFTETIGGLDPILEEVEGEILRLAAFGGENAWQEFSARLSTAVREAREAIQKDYDPLLDRRSFDRDRVKAMLERAYQRFGLELDEDEELDLEEGLSTIARDLDERLEETVVSIAERIGLQVESEESGDAFEVRISVGEQATEALAGFDLDEDEVVEGTFWRDTAVEREEKEYLATGHPVVEALINYVRDGELGRTAAIRVKSGRNHAFGACFSFLIQLPEAEDLAQGSHVPSRQAERLLENVLIRVGVELGADGSVRVNDGLLSILDDGRPQSTRPGELPMSAVRWEQAIRSLESAAKEEARRRLVETVQAAETRLAGELSRRLDRLALDSERGDEDEKLLRAAEMMQEQGFADSVRRALRASSLTLDSACTLAVEPAAPFTRAR